MVFTAPNRTIFILTISSPFPVPGRGRSTFCCHFIILDSLGSTPRLVNSNGAGALLGSVEARESLTGDLCTKLLAGGEPL
mmetsp:Transcript_18831/g.23862  ORF Transcript_18831/g.23862 Transcript_18831/m.23862 type:complete len:80 (+) Transcript_18831:215-454(+)